MAITTVGFGDHYPVTSEGRLVSVIIMSVGVALFGTLTGFLANAFLVPPRRKPLETSTANDPKAKLAELRQMLEEQKQAQTSLEAKISEIEALL